MFGLHACDCLLSGMFFLWTSGSAAAALVAANRDNTQRITKGSDPIG